MVVGSGRVHNGKPYDLYCLSYVKMINDSWQDVWGIRHAWERKETIGEVGMENVMERGHLTCVKEVGG